MTREEERSKAAYSQYCNSESICFNLMCNSFKQGAQWADENPKSPWISVKDDLPCNHEEMVQTDFTDRVLVLSKNGYHEVANMCIIEGKWEWNTLATVLYWMPIPKLPK